MPLMHQHPPGVFDPGHCHTCARQAGLLDHYWQVQREEDTLRRAAGRRRPVDQLSPTPPNGNASPEPAPVAGMAKE